MNCTQKVAVVIVALTAMVIMFTGCPGDTDSGTKVTPPVDVTAVTLNETSKAIDVNDEFDLTATILPANATNKTVSWASSNTQIVEVTGSGLTVKIKAKAAGNATITVTADGGKIATCTVTVSTPLPASISVAVRTQTNAGANTTPNSDSLITLTRGKWTGTQVLTGNATGTPQGGGGNGMARTTLLWVNKPMTTGYTFRAKITWPGTSPAAIIFGEFIDPDATISGIPAQTASPQNDTSSFSMSPSVTPSASSPGYRGFTGIRINAPPTDGNVTVASYGLMNENALLGKNTLSTLPGYLDEVPTGTSNVTWSMTGHTQEVAHIWELTYTPSTRTTDGYYTYKIYPASGNTAAAFTRRVGSTGGSSPSPGTEVPGGDVDSIDIPLKHVNSHFGFEYTDRTENTAAIFPGIMIWNPGSITISEVELIQR